MSDVSPIVNQLYGLNQEGFALTAEGLAQLQSQANDLVSTTTKLTSSSSATLFPQDGTFILMSHPPESLEGPVVEFDSSDILTRMIIGTGSPTNISAAVGVTSSDAFVTLYVSPTANLSLDAITGIALNGPALTLKIAGTNSATLATDSVSALAGNLAGKTMWALGQIANKGVIRIADGSGAGGWDTQGASIYGTGVDGQLRAGSLVLGNAAGGNRFNGTGDTFTSLSNNVANHNLWSLYQFGGKGRFVISDGTGAGGQDSLGAYVYADGTYLNTNRLTVTNELTISSIGNLLMTAGSTVQTPSGTPGLTTSLPITVGGVPHNVNFSAGWLINVT